MAEKSYNYLYPLWTGRTSPTVDAKGVQKLLGLLPDNPAAAKASPD